MSFMLLGILNSQAAGGAAGAYDLLETTTLASSASSVTFSGLGSYSDYAHLQARWTGRNGSAGGAVYMRFNGDTGANYVQHQLYGNGSIAQSGYNDGQSLLSWNMADSNTASNVFTSYVMDILDFANSNKLTTGRSVYGRTEQPVVAVISHLWKNTSPVTSIVFLGGPTFAAGSRFSIYGIKAD